MNKTNIVVGLGLIVVLALGMTFPRGGTVVERVVERVNESLGSLPSNDIVETRLSIGGADYFSYSAPMKPNTTMPCSFRTPPATTTLIAASGDFRIGSSTAATAYLGISTNGTTLGTTLSSNALGAGAKANIIYFAASSTVIAPSQYVVVNVPGGAISTAPQGTCTALLQVISKF